MLHLGRRDRRRLQQVHCRDDEMSNVTRSAIDCRATTPRREPFQRHGTLAPETPRRAMIFDGHHRHACRYGGSAANAAADMDGIYDCIAPARHQANKQSRGGQRLIRENAS